MVDENTQTDIEGIRRRLQDLLKYPRESLDIEYKPWLDLTSEEDKAILARALLALANHGGGYVVIGYQQSGESWIPADPHPAGLGTYSQDKINGIAKGFAEPIFHCDVHHIPHPDRGDVYPIIVVPGGHRVPIRAKKSGPYKKHVIEHAYYTRRPGPASESPQSGQEWDELIMRCVRAAREDLLQSMRQLLIEPSQVLTGVRVEKETTEVLPRSSALKGPAEIPKNWVEKCRARWEALVLEKLPNEKPSRYAHGVWIASYALAGNFAKPSPQNFRGILDQVQGRETGWPPWWVPTSQNTAPYAYDKAVECWIIDERFNDPAHSDFWRASPEGLMFLLRGYQEDGVPDKFKPGTIFDLTIPVWRVGEVLLHAERLSKAMADSSIPVTAYFRWEGLAGRELYAWAGQRHLREGRISRQDVVESEITVQSDQIITSLPEIVEEITQPLYSVFDFFEPPLKMIEDELAEMRGIRR